MNLSSRQDAEKKCCLLYLSMQFFCQSCGNSVKDNYFKCNEMSAPT